MVQIIMYRYNITVSLVRILLKNRELYIDEIYGYYKIGNLTTPVIIFTAMEVFPGIILMFLLLLKKGYILWYMV